MRSLGTAMHINPRAAYYCELISSTRVRGYNTHLLLGYIKGHCVNEITFWRFICIMNDGPYLHFVIKRQVYKKHLLFLVSAACVCVSVCEKPKKKLRNESR